MNISDIYQTRVTKLGEFSPIGRLFTVDSLLKITEAANGKSYALNRQKSVG
jgi:hypothetical protein